MSYRGFYDEADARRHAEKLRAQGYDVYVGGVPAYSTLGWSDDPLLSTFIRYSDAQLARLNQSRFEYLGEAFVEPPWHFRL